MLPQLRKLEERFPQELVVVGVHSAKFDAEKETFNVRQAVMRHDVRHPVVNDRDFLLWRAYAVRAWPTIVIVDPDGAVIGAHSGEFDAAALGDLFQEILADLDTRGRLDRTPLPLLLEKQKQPEMLLSFPGRVLAVAPEDAPAELREPDGLLFVADTEHHRILRFGLGGGRVRGSYGSGTPGLRDGPAGQARFHAPQGMALRDGSLYVADTGSHAVRKIALDTGVVTTVSGTGEQAAGAPAPAPGGPGGAGSARYARLNSPWDVLAAGDSLFVAMAGSHQIWRIDLPSGRLELFAGDGREALQDGPRREARLAQPSGLAAAGGTLWFADSETSSIRCVPLEGEGEVRTAIGKGLFDFGDVDGTRSLARLQHVLGLACAGGLVYAADAYNNRIKVFDPAAGSIRSLSGGGEPGNQDGPPADVSFWEPGGLSAAGDLLYVADTNNHAVRVVHRRTGEARTLELRE